MTIPGFDMAWGEKPYTEAKALGYRFVMRYLSHDPSKDLSLDELREWTRLGLAVGVVWESTAGRALQGRTAGAQDAHAAQAKLNALGIPHLPVYFAVDFDATDRDKPKVADYMRGAQSVLGYLRTGAYGGYYTIDYLLAKRAVHFAWQTYAWSGGKVHKGAHLFQYENGYRIGKASCDLDHALVPDAGLTKTFGDRKRRIWEQHLKSAEQKLRQTLAERRQLRREHKTRTHRYAWTTARMHLLKTRIAVLKRLIGR